MKVSNSYICKKFDKVKTKDSCKYFDIYENSTIMINMVSTLPDGWEGFESG